jgi:hypothetical protein
MTSLFANKIIYIFSPQPWSYLQISKHHYARALSKNNRVYFISPPHYGTQFTFSVSEEQPGLHLVKYALAVPGFLRFKLPAMYKWLLRFYLSGKLRTSLPLADVAFDFGCYQQFDNMNFIRATHKIFFPVDDFGTFKADDRGADLVLSVSKNIQDKFPAGKCHFINHGLSEEFSNRAIQNTHSWQQRGAIKVGCAGNLFIRFLDAETLSKLIAQHSSVEFHFFGSQDSDLSMAWQRTWKEILENSPNVHLRGKLSSQALAEAYDDMDAFLLCYKPDYINYHGENSHKVLEYLSTGRVLVATHLKIYENSRLFEMSPNNENEELVSVFDKVISDIGEYNSSSRSQLRKNYALDHTYDKNIDRISKLISDCK